MFAKNFHHYSTFRIHAKFISEVWRKKVLDPLYWTLQQLFFRIFPCQIDHFPSTFTFKFIYFHLEGSYSVKITLNYRIKFYFIFSFFILFFLTLLFCAMLLLPIHIKIKAQVQLKIYSTWHHFWNVNAQ